MGEPEDDLKYQEYEASPELMERKPDSDPQMAREDPAGYRSAVIVRLDHLIDVQTKTAKAIALLVQEIKKGNSK